MKHSDTAFTVLFGNLMEHPIKYSLCQSALNAREKVYVLFYERELSQLPWTVFNKYPKINDLDFFLLDSLLNSEINEMHEKHIPAHILSGDHFDFHYTVI